LTFKPLFYIPLMLLTPLLIQAGPVLITGTPADDSSLPNTPASPKIGGLINFDSLPSCGVFPPDSTCTNYSGTTFAGGVTISSPDGLYAIPYSAQTPPNELFDNSADGSANISIGLAGGAGAIGVGIADSDTDVNGDPVDIFLQALNSTDGDLGSAFEVTLPETGGNPGNGYFVIADTTPDIYGLRITQPVGSAGNYSGLAIDDVQVSPEPSTFLLLIGGVAMLGSYRLRKRA